MTDITKNHAVPTHMLHVTTTFFCVEPDCGAKVSKTAEQGKVKDTTFALLSSALRFGWTVAGTRLRCGGCSQNYISNLHRADEDDCPRCGLATMKAQPRGGTACRSKECTYWFCY
jgi:DNA-directed RNA polymerase subunit RPC12/RpoP